MHWFISQRSLRVYIDPSDSSSERQAVWEAFVAWETLLQGRVQFVSVHQKELADIEVSWSSSTIPSQVAEFANATCEKTIRGSSEILHARILLGQENPYTHQPFSVRQTQQLALHEVGHALGLEHSGDARDIMYPGLTEKTPLFPSFRDIQTLMLIYQDATLVSRQASPSGVLSDSRNP